MTKISYKDLKKTNCMEFAVLYLSIILYNNLTKNNNNVELQDVALLTVHSKLACDTNSALFYF